MDAASILSTITAHVRAGLADHRPDSTGIPRSLALDGSLRTVTPRDWTSGFFAGMLWQLFRFSGDTAVGNAAKGWTALLESETGKSIDHDIGFRIYCSYGQGWKATKDSAYREAILRAAGALSKRFNPTVRAIKSWDYPDRGWQYPVIIDNMMNLELLFAATRLSGDSTYYEIAARHAATTLKNHFREDGSSYHVIDYDSTTGAVRQRHTHQGAADESAWARGQSWGLYGFTMAFRETGEPRYLEQARGIASFILDNPHLPSDGVPYWDYDAPGMPETERDVSAAAILASALFELRAYVPAGEAARYESTADRLLRTLWTEYRAPDNAWPFVLSGSVGNMNIGSEVGVPIIYADYFFVEALRRRLELGAK